MTVDDWWSLESRLCAIGRWQTVLPGRPEEYADDHARFMAVEDWVTRLDRSLKGIPDENSTGRQLKDVIAAARAELERLIGKSR